MLDLMKIAVTESEGGELETVLGQLYQKTEVRPNGFLNAIVWKGGKHDQIINPVCHSLTDAYALLGTIAAADILNLPFYAIPMWSQMRHDTKLEALSWFGSMQNTSIKWSTAGDAYVNDGSGNFVDNPLTKEPDGVTDIPSDVKAVCNLFWTTEIKDAYKVFLEATKQPSS